MRKLSRMASHILVLLGLGVLVALEVIYGYGLYLGAIRALLVLVDIRHDVGTLVEIGILVGVGVLRALGVLK